MTKKQLVEHYESLIGKLRYGEYGSNEIDEICKSAISRPAIEKEFFDLFEQQKRLIPPNQSFTCCLCVDEIVGKIIQALSKEVSR